MLARPKNALGEVVFVCALPTDTVQWVLRQMDEDDAVTVVVSVADSLIWANTFESSSETAPGHDPHEELGCRPADTLGEVMRDDKEPCHLAA